MISNDIMDKADLIVKELSQKELNRKYRAVVFLTGVKKYAKNNGITIITVEGILKPEIQYLLKEHLMYFLYYYRVCFSPTPVPRGADAGTALSATSSSWPSRGTFRTSWRS